jgi:molybdopterin-biosynthesis enzyme MoeA-like protein
VNACRARYDYVFTTGGIGPTHDDISSAAVAKAFGVPLSLNAEAVGRLERHYPAGKLNEARLRMAMVPEGASLIDNPISAAPGFRIGNVFVLAGVPMIVEAMFHSLKHRLVGGAPVLSRTVRTSLPEGTIAEPLAALQSRYEDLEIGSYPSFRQGKISTGLVLRGTDATRLDQGARELVGILAGMGGEPDLLEA